MKTEDTNVLDETQLAQVTGGTAHSLVLSGPAAVSVYTAFDVRSLATDLKINLASSVIGRLKIDALAIGGAVTQ
jgi:bacteriocin-like protein